MIPPEIVVADPGELARRLVARFEAEAKGAIAARGRFALALPGGSVATSLFPHLRQAAVDWSHVDFFWGDERAVAPDHPDSNYGVAQHLWLGHANPPSACIHRMPAEAADLATACTAYEAELRRVLGTPPRLDMALLGVGPDGHVCSLFAGHPLLDEMQRFVATLEDAPKPPPRRMTLTRPALAAAALVVVFATGAAKAAPVRAAVRETDSALPLALVIRAARRSLLLLDAAAASLL